MAHEQAYGGVAMKQNPEHPAPVRSFPPNAVHLVRTTQNNTLQLSQMADNKASILMGATFVVFSIAVSRSLGGNLPLSLAVLAVFAFLSSLFAVLAVLPTTRKPPGPIQPNLLFFGHFVDMEEEQWTDAVLDQLQHDETTYRTMLHDIYQNGQVLHRRKYRYLGYAYQCFVVGLLATLVAFVAEVALNY
jgi:Family of unknown function (DUF5706)